VISVCIGSARSTGGSALREQGVEAAGPSRGHHPIGFKKVSYDRLARAGPQQVQYWEP
jgi:hypothetical protein